MRFKLFVFGHYEGVVTNYAVWPIAPAPAPVGQTTELPLKRFLGGLN